MAHSHLTIEQREDWKNLKGNFTETPNYLDLVIGIWHALTWYYRPHMWDNYTFPR